jgi:hypothetical protein
MRQKRVDVLYVDRAAGRVQVLLVREPIATETDGDAVYTISRENLRFGSAAWHMTFLPFSAMI